MTLVADFILAQKYVTRYLLSTVLILGTLGNIIAIAIFAQKKHRTNSCSIYLITISIFGLLAANWAIAPLLYALDHFDMVNSSLVLCCIRGYITHVNSMCFRYTLVLMCADRYALCNSRASIRAFCQPKIAYRSIGMLIIFWSIASIHLLIWESIENNRCGVYGLYGQIFSFYSLIFTGIIPTLIMIFIIILLVNNLRQMHRLIQSMHNSRRLNPHDISLIRIVLIEIVVYILCTTTYPLMSIYLNVTNTMGLYKSTERRQIESFTNFITMSMLLYLNYNTTFYIHFVTSKTYRKQVKRSLWKLISKYGAR